MSEVPCLGSGYPPPRHTHPLDIHPRRTYPTHSPIPPRRHLVPEIPTHRKGHGTRDTQPPHGPTNTCENITFPQLHLGGKNKYANVWLSCILCAIIIRTNYQYSLVSFANVLSKYSIKMTIYLSRFVSNTFRCVSNTFETSGSDL